jgi:hydroxyacylglutathione hydrolase
MVQKRRKHCSCHPDRLSNVNIVSKQLRIGYSVYNTWLGRYIHNMNIVKTTTERVQHTKTEQIDYGHCSVLPIPYLDDNYAYLIVCHKTGHCAVVDPGDSTAVEVALIKLKLPEHCPPVTLTTILTTHGHWDHDGGNRDLLVDYPHLIVVGGKGDGVDGCTRPVEDNDEIKIGELSLSAVWTPCHTPFHMCYHYKSINNTTSLLFSGDTLFVGGVGRFWEGEACDMQVSLNKLKCLSPETLIYCGHEYAVQNLTFNRFAEPDNEDIKQMLEDCKKKRESQLQLVPTSLKNELKWNSFLRAEKLLTLKVETVTTMGRAADVLYTLRRAKDQNMGAGLRFA